jgi:UDP-N-acetylmuramate: L-alanyl-gamma-D-glutamyl-meso-diaminopimelate ligase
MHLHILGICGTFMGGIAALAVAAGHRVTGCDANVYPPMSDQLKALGIDLIEGYGAEQIKLKPDIWLIGNVVTRGNPLMEAIMATGGQRFESGPQWLNRNILHDKWVTAVAGTHGKTTTTALLTWVLEQNGINPGFLVGGVPVGFPVSARLTDSIHFVIEADEYDTAFFDKRSKFVHYHPRTAIFNNLEFDHADIFTDLAAIENQFHQLVRIVPNNGRIVANRQSQALERVLQRGCWSEQQWFEDPNQWHTQYIGEQNNPAVHWSTGSQRSLFHVFKGHDFPL